MDENNLNEKGVVNGKKNNILVIILILIIILLLGYICYEKFFVSNANNVEEIQNNNQNKTEEENNDKTEDDNNKETVIKVLSNGTVVDDADFGPCFDPKETEGFIYGNDGCAAYNESHLYTIDGDGIIGNIDYNNISLYNKHAYIYDNGVLMKVNNNGEVVKEKTIANGLGIVRDALVMSKDNGVYLYLIDDDNSIYLGSSEQGYTYSVYGSMYYPKNDVNNKEEGYYIIFTNHDIESGSGGEVDQNGNVLNSYEYYYLPSSNTTGKEKTWAGGYAKPVLYLYPENDNTRISVSFEKPYLLTTTYPKYTNGWSVVANKNGDLHDEDDKYYYGLYWEEEGSTKVDFSEGFYVTKDNAIDFLEEKLRIIGLNDRERNEFIMYWLPILEKNGKSLVYFELTEERNTYNKLLINPNPDSMLRIAIHVKRVDKEYNINEEKLESFNRSGFAAVEWGGVVY